MVSIEAWDHTVWW